MGGELISGPDSVATVLLSTRDDSALAGTNGDYIATTREIQLSSQTPEVEVTIPIVDDEDEEPDKRFFVDLDVVEPLPFAVELASRYDGRGYDPGRRRDHRLYVTELLSTRKWWPKEVRLRSKAVNWPSR